MAEGCPAGVSWCPGDHRCRPQLGEHRSEPLSLPARYGGLVATRVRDRGGREHLEVRASVRLPAGDDRARDAARVVLLAVDLAVRDVLAGRLGRARAAYQRLTGVRVRG